MNFNPMLMTDFYKISHRIMSEEGTEKIYSTLTPRGSRIQGLNEVVFFGLQGFIKEYLMDYFNDNFFKQPKEKVVGEYKRIIANSLGAGCADTTHIEALHDLGYLPIKIYAVPEGTLIPLRIPVMTIENTVPEFYWITNFLETLISAEMWRAMTSTTVVKQYKDICDFWADRTADSRGHVQWQCHNFSYRGMSGNMDAIKTGAGQLLFFTGTDTIPSIQYLEAYYGADSDKELIGASVLATEHSIQCQYGDDYKYYKHMITNVAPSGIVSIVSDGYDYWNVLTDVIPRLKEEIMNRDGKLVVRPDSGNPADIICGDPEADEECVRKGSIEVLWDTFGGTVNKKGYKVLDSHIGLIYGDAITPLTAQDVFRRLEEKGFSSENIVFGIGSYSLGYHTRDTFSMAIKATYTVIDGQEKFIFKNPKTDNGIKKSQTGMVNVVQHLDGSIHMHDGMNAKQRSNVYSSLFDVVFEDGVLKKETTLQEIRDRVLK